MLDQGQQPDGVFVGGALRVGADAPTAAPAGRVVDGEDDVGVAGINDEQHGVSPIRRVVACPDGTLESWQAGRVCDRPGQMTAQCQGVKLVRAVGIEPTLCCQN